MGFLRGLRRWWALRNPEIRWIVEVGVDEVPDDEHPIRSLSQNPMSMSRAP